ncbi:MAG: catalase family protein [Planctomycetes bacterium]|nr:catalase family protein [Planctomycetota bacterium]
MIQPGMESVPSDEEALIERLVTQNLKLLDESTRPIMRGQHPKHHGCVRAEFVVEDGLDGQLRHGLFAEPATFPALIRFSNGASMDDRKGDAHGMAIKLFDVPGDKLLAQGNTHDFVLIDHPVFFARDAAGYVELFDALLKAKQSVLPKLAFFLPRFIAEMGHVYLTHLHNHPDELAIMRAMISKHPDSPLASRYWSTTPYRLGPHAVKWCAQPHAAPAPSPSDSADKLRIALANHLATSEASFDFMVQLQTEPESMPIEDPRREWDAQRSPWRKVATLKLPVQKPDTPELMTFCEHLAFNPWRCLPEHRPLGGVNRARKAIYDALSRRRHELNGVAQAEPDLSEFQQLWAS